MGTGEWGAPPWGRSFALQAKDCIRASLERSADSGALSIFAGKSGPAFGNTVSLSTQADAQSTFTSLALKAISLVVSMLSKRMR